MTECPWSALRRLPPDPVQLQVILGSLLGDARIRGERGQRRLEIRHSAARAGYVRWKYERLGALAAEAPRTVGATASFETIAHPLFDDLSALKREQLLDRVGALGLAVWLTDVGRLQLRPDSFLPLQRECALRD